jgi:hypothetical protein
VVAFLQIPLNRPPNETEGSEGFKSIFMGLCICDDFYVHLLKHL